MVCLDETSKQLIAEICVPIAAKPGRPARTDYQYERNGTANIFMLFVPLEGWRHVEVTARHTAVDYAHLLKQVSDTWFPNAPKIALLPDNLSTHKPASLYEAFPAAEARRFAERFEWHYTPKLGSWLNMAETELSVLSGQCLDRRIPDKARLTEEAAAWTAQRNQKHAKADWLLEFPSGVVSGSFAQISIRCVGRPCRFLPVEPGPVRRRAALVRARRHRQRAG